ncbi:MAG: PilT/PilU family type 4a pilus ATPase [Bryobacteraceae bacterium]|nr:PilT/PilU family type 4a pilus ATPase [Bryobacteraceae bacterium]
MAGYDSELARIVEQLNKAAPGGTKAERAQQGVSNQGAGGALVELLAAAARLNASDLLLIAGAAPVMRVTGALMFASGPDLSGDDIRSLLLPLLNAAQYEELLKKRFVDFGFAQEGIGRFRANIHYQRGTLAGAIRLLPHRIPSLESLNMPAGLGRLTERRQGLVLVTGPTGSGKSSTLAALIDMINGARRDHIVTIEDPIEFHHANRRSVVEQIEVGRDAPDFAGTLRSVLRQSPDVILVGEMRDPETIGTVLTAAETGHLVFSTLHTNDTAQTVSRILDSFPTGNQPQIRLQFSLALLAIIAQQLAPAADGRGRYPAVEIMIGTDAIKNLIRRGQDQQLRSQVAMGRHEGMFTMEQSLAELVRSGRISRETAFAHCFRADELTRYLEER